MTRLRLYFLLLAGCASAATKDTTAKRDAADAALLSAPDAGGALATVDAAAPVEAPAPVTAFYPVAQGACAAARPVLVGQTPILQFAKAAWAMPANGLPRVLAQQYAPHYDAFVGAVLGENWRIAFLGGLDEEHLWYTLGNFSGRGEDQTALFLGQKRLATPEGNYGAYGIQNVIQQPDGSIWAYGQHGMYLDIPGDEKIPQRDDAPAWRYNRWFAWSNDGTPLDKANLPMGDMALAQRLENGELVAAGTTAKSNHAQLRRWSPTRKVDDFSTNEPVKYDETPEVRIGRMRAVMTVPRKNVFYTYDGKDKFGVAPITARVKAPTSWLVTQNDELWVTENEKVFIETRDGVITEESLPERATLARETSIPWLMGSSGAVYERSGHEWRKLSVPDGLWSDPQHPPNKVEWVAVLGRETWVGTVRTDRGFGFKTPTEVRTFYSSRARPTKIRCGSPFEASMLYPLPPRAGEECKDLVVLLGRERGKDGKPAIPWTKIAAALKGDAALGESLKLGIFGPASAYGIHAPTRAIADVLVKKLAHVTLHEPELICGADDEKTTATLDVKAGAFASIPDAGAR